jgi:hypothetical protein
MFRHSKNLQENGATIVLQVKGAAFMKQGQIIAAPSIACI